VDSVLQGQPPRDGGNALRRSEQGENPGFAGDDLQQSPSIHRSRAGAAHQFTEVGLVQQIAVDGSKAFFDTNTAAHHHFFLSGEHDLVDIPADEVVLGKMPEPPSGYEIIRVDVVIRLRKKARS
jgi:hypothetical protein